MYRGFLLLLVDLHTLFLLALVHTNIISCGLVLGNVFHVELLGWHVVVDAPWMCIDHYMYQFKTFYHPFIMLPAKDLLSMPHHRAAPDPKRMINLIILQVSLLLYLFHCITTLYFFC